MAIRPLIQVQRVSNLDQCLKHFTSWASAAWRLSGHAEGILFHPLFLHFLFPFVCVKFDWEKKTHILEKLQVDASLLESIYVIRRRTILVLHRFRAVILIFCEHVELESPL